LDFQHFAQTGRTVTGLDYFAWQNGPFPKSLEAELKTPPVDFTDNFDLIRKPFKATEGMREALDIVPKTKFNPNVFTKRELSLLEAIADEFSLNRADEMIRSTHLPGDPWDRVYHQEQRKRQQIPLEYAVDKSDDQHVNEVLLAAQEHQEMLENYA
jgi:hypothetical protein